MFIHLLGDVTDTIEVVEAGVTFHLVQIDEGTGQAHRLVIDRHALVQLCGLSGLEVRAAA